MRAGAPRRGVSELKRVRNFKPAFKRGLGRDSSTPRGKRSPAARLPGHSGTPPDWSRLEKLDQFTSPERHWVERSLPPRDRVSFVFFAGNTHEESQPVHLKVATPHLRERCAREFGNPCERFCPADVYEMVA